MYIFEVRFLNIYSGKETTRRIEIPDYYQYEKCYYIQAIDIAYNDSKRDERIISIDLISGEL